MSNTGVNPFEGGFAPALPTSSPTPPQQQPVVSTQVTTSAGPGTITYIIGICLMVAVALCLAVLACLLRRKHRRNQALMAAERESRLAALREAEALEAMRLAELGVHPYKAPIVVVQPNGEAVLASQLGQQNAAAVAVVAVPCAAAAPALAQPSGASVLPPFLQPSPFQGQQFQEQQAQQMATQRLQLQQQQQELVASARAAWGGAPPQPDWQQAGPPPSRTPSRPVTQ